MTARAGLGLAVLAAAGCAGIGSPGAGNLGSSATPAVTAAPAPVAESTPAPEDAVPWETIDAFLQAERGRYTEITGVSGDLNEHEILMQEIIRFDLAVPYIDRTLRLPAERLDADDPPGDLRFVYTDDAMLMWHPATLEQCGTHWIDMSDAAYGDILGFEVQPADLLAVKPLELVAAALDEPRLIRTGPEGSTYEVTVPADMGVSVSSDLRADAEAMEILMDTDVVAEVVLPPDDGALKVAVDLTDVYSAMDPDAAVPPGVAVRTTWTVATGIPPFDTSLPEDVADVSCMDPGTAT